MSIDSRPIPLRSLAATADNTVLSLLQPGRMFNFAKAWRKFPVEYAAGCVHGAIPAATFAELFGSLPTGAASLTLDPAAFQRHGWNVKLREEIFLAAAVRQTPPKTIFEIGAFDGNATRGIADVRPSGRLAPAASPPGAVSILQLGLGWPDRYEQRT
jgi:hypothetical protein